MSDCCDLIHQHEEAHRLEVSGLCVSYGTHNALHGIEFSITCGHRLALLGPNGGGKSTLIRTLAGLIRPEHGEVLWRGVPLLGSTREIAYLPQLERHREGFPVTVRDVVMMGRLPHLGLWRRFRKLDEEKVDEALEVMGMADRAGSQIDALSGGQRQRAFLARALAQEAHIMLLDEPFTGLDVESSADLIVVLEDLAKRGHLVIASHHNLANVGQVFDTALVLARDQIAYTSATKVMSDPQVCRELGWKELS